MSYIQNYKLKHCRNTVIEPLRNHLTRYNAIRYRWHVTGPPDVLVPQIQLPSQILLKPQLVPFEKDPAKLGHIKIYTTIPIKYSLSSTMMRPRSYYY